ncbi:MAG: low molecular weight phosphotyrosine protein phosphatase [Thiobacillaceae bacterium]|nr:low molecular weight phosphotyrosine protein phosphatase [Thiobacillaceae bacterium]MCX7674046.1 low molecular weight phosphotyrosine protein phosphatase [Thiobacillaceae bacterium]MDW8322734.1 low molecular weight protein-tyrosine-phosphatase [Burkholderiales bacterium]
MNPARKYHILLVCMGNICRSPTAEGVLRRRLQDAGLMHRVIVDSAGTHGYHVGSPPDRRAQEAAARRGYDLSRLIARQVGEQDCSDFDLVLAMDWDNLGHLERLCPPQHRHKLRLFLSFSRRYAGQEVPDPYYGGREGFERVLDMVEDAADGLVEFLQRELGLKPHAVTVSDG